MKEGDGGAVNSSFEKERWSFQRVQRKGREDDSRDMFPERNKSRIPVVVKRMTLTTAHIQWSCHTCMMYNTLKRLEIWFKILPNGEWRMAECYILCCSQAISAYFQQEFNSMRKLARLKVVRKDRAVVKHQVTRVFLTISNRG
ncbi:hypothetical protein Ancab_007362 [Ancistrocladus abbreviatus]